MYGERIAAVTCWAHVRRKLFDVHAATASATAREPLDHIAGLCAVEARCVVVHPASEDANAKPEPLR